MKTRAVFLLALFLIFAGCAQNQLPGIGGNEACVNELESRNMVRGEDYEAGEILVGFKETVPENQARQVISSYGLEIENVLDLSIENEYAIVVRVKVDEESEFNWICNLMKNQSVEYAEVNGIAHIN